MADGDAQMGAGGKPGRLVDRLQKRLERLEKIQLAGDPKRELEAALRDLREDVADLKIIAPHVYGIPPTRRSR